MSWVLQDAVQSNWAGNGFQAWTPTAPASLGELMIVAMLWANDGTPPGSMVVTPPASGGWTQRGTRFHMGGGETFEIWTKVAGASEPASYTWTYDVTPFPTAANGVIFSGQDPTTPLEVVTDWANIHTGGPGPFPAASIDTLSDGAINLLFVTDAFRTGGFTCDSGYNEAIDNAGAWYYKEIPTAGPTGTKNVTVPVGFGCAVFQFSLKVDASAIPPPPPPVALASTLGHRINTRPAIFAPGGTGRR